LSLSSFYVFLSCFASIECKSVDGADLLGTYHLWACDTIVFLLAPMIQLRFYCFWLICWFIDSLIIGQKNFPPKKLAVKQRQKVVVVVLIVSSRGHLFARFLFIHSVDHFISCIHSFVCLFVCLFLRSFIDWLVHSLTDYWTSLVFITRHRDARWSSILSKLWEWDDSWGAAGTCWQDTGVVWIRQTAAKRFYSFHVGLSLCSTVITVRFRVRSMVLVHSNILHLVLRVTDS